MNNSPDARLSQLLDQWEEAAERGQVIDLAQLCADCPELKEELARQIEALQAMDKRLIHQEETQEDLVGKAVRDANSTFFTTARFAELRWLAQGGLGAVYQAQDDELHREVVLKFIHHHISESNQHRSVFRREAEITSRLDHPGVVPVYGLGESADGRCFYVMRYIQGETLDHAIDEFHQSAETRRHQGRLRQLLAHFITVCKTIAYAHNRGIIHRDIKPANIMLGKYGETLVVDWGLAMPFGRNDQFRESGEETLMPTDTDAITPFGQGAGTPAYMSPEVAEKSVVLGPTTDIYSLGASLYKILTGTPPFTGNSFPEIREKILGGNFPRPTQLAPATSRALEAICMKAMQTESSKRYATALEMASDIESYLADEPIGAYDEPLPRRIARWGRRHRSIMGTMVVSALVLMGITFVSAAWLGYLAQSEREARVSAEVASRQSLQMSARFAARTIAGQIDLRWRILEAAVRDAEVKDIIASINELPDDTAQYHTAQAWLNQQFIQLKDENTLDFNSMFLLDARGTQVARTPISQTVGNSYAFRDYFHGQGFDLSEEEAAEVEPIQNPNLSATYSSDTSSLLKVAFTVPIYSNNGVHKEVIGVLGMSVELGEFAILDTELNGQEIVVLVDLRPDTIDGTSERGLILHHPLQSARVDQTASMRVSQELLALIDSDETSLQFDNYSDPAAGGNWYVAIERLVVDGRRGANRFPGWAVMVQEKKEP